MTVEQVDERIHDALAEYGFAVISVGDPAGEFSYSIGFTDLGHPEVILCGLDALRSWRVLWQLYEEIRSFGKSYAEGDLDTDLGSLPVAFRAVTPENAKEFCFQALRWYLRTSTVPSFLQLVLPDAEGRMPWQANHNSEQTRAQRRLWAAPH